MTSAPEQTDVLAVARAHVLEGGIGLSERQALSVLRLPDEALPELLALAHEVRMRWVRIRACSVASTRSSSATT